MNLISFGFPQRMLPWLIRWSLLGGLGLSLMGCGNDDPETPPQGSLVFFARAGAATADVPLTVFLGNDSVGRLTQSVPARPTSPTETGALRVQRSSGNFRWLAAGASGIFFAGNSTVTQGTDTYVELDGGTLGNVAFWVSNPTMSTGQPVTVVLDGLDTLGTITARRATAPSGCLPPAYLLASRPAGTYSFFAFTPNNACIWSGSVTVTAGGACPTPIALGSCAN